MSTLKFLNKPPTKPIGPQPKPKAAFLDPGNPWATPSTRSGTGSTPPARLAPPKTPARSAPTPQRAAVPSRGYNYTESDTASGKPAYVRRQEIDQAQMAAQATQQRRARPAPTPAPVKPVLTVAARPLQLANAGDDYEAQRMAVRNAAPPRPQPQPETPARPAPPDAWDVARAVWGPMYRYPNPLWTLGYGMDALTLFMDGTAEAWNASAPPANNLATRAAPQQPTPQAATTYQPTPAQPAYRPASATSTVTATPAPVTNAAPWQMAPTAEQAMAARPMQPTPTRAAPTPTQQTAQPSQMAPTAEQAIPVRSMQPAPPNVATPGIDVPAPLSPTTTPTTTQATASGPFYGYAPPDAMTAPRTVDTQRGQRMPYYMTDRPNVSGWGQRALMTDEALAAEDARRQRDAAGSFSALQASGRYRPWSSYSPAEKYYLRYGVMPEGAQLAPDTSGAEALAANEAQNQRLYDEYWDRYRPVIRGRRWYGGMRPGQEQTMYGSEMAAAMQQRVQPAGTQAAPATTTTAATPAQAAQIAKNNQIVMQVNPQAATTGVRAQDANAVAREIAKRYMPDKDVSTLTLAEIGAILAMSYTPPPGLAQQYGYDMEWLAQYVPTK